MTWNSPIVGCHGVIRLVSNLFSIETVPLSIDPEVIKKNINKWVMALDNHVPSSKFNRLPHRMSIFE
jgi:hypothetical protein